VEVLAVGVVGGVVGVLEVSGAAARVVVVAGVLAGLREALAAGVVRVAGVVPGLVGALGLRRENRRDLAGAE
jgi:hypothetical protein